MDIILHTYCDTNMSILFGGKITWLINGAEKFVWKSSISEIVGKVSKDLYLTFFRNKNPRFIAKPYTHKKKTTTRNYKNIRRKYNMYDYVPNVAQLLLPSQSDQIQIWLQLQ